MVFDIQAGIVLWSIKPCASPPYAGVFTAVSPYIDWIEENTGITFGRFSRSVKKSQRSDITEN